MNRIFPDLGPLAKAFFSYRQKAHSFLDHIGGNDFVVLSEPDAYNASGSPSDGPDIIFLKSGGKPAPGADNDVIVPRGLFNGNQLIALVQCHRYYSFCPWVAVFAELCLFHN